MEMINRSAVILKPRQPYLDWTRRDDNEGLADTVFENLHTEPTVYLLPEYEDPSTQREVLEELWPALFEAMLAGWATDEALWPKNRTVEMFREWFEVQMSSVVQDLYVGEPLEYFDKPRSLKEIMARLVGRVFGEDAKNTTSQPSLSPTRASTCSCDQTSL